jgi:flagella synthesis protein FlgN
MSKPSEALAQMLRDMHADRSSYARLRELLEAQFQAALRHRAEQLTELAEDIVVLVGQIEVRRQQRGTLLSRLLGPASKPTLEALLQRLPAAAGQTITVAWQGLEQQVRECKSLNLRNCQLITDQHALMQRVLGVEEPGYAER